MTTDRVHLSKRSRQAGGDPAIGARLAAAFLAGVSALALLAIALTLTEAPINGEARTPDAVPIRNFYAAANEIFAGGDGTALDASVAPDLIAHGAGNAIVDRAEFARRLARLGAASPGLRFSLDAVTVDGDHATAAVSLVGGDSVLGISVQGERLSVPRLETFRLAQDRIAEYWPAAPDDNDARTLPPLPLALSDGETSVGLARFTYPPGASLTTNAAPGSELLIGEIGVVSVRLSEPASWWRADAPEAGWRPIAAEVDVELRPNDALLVPSMAAREIRNPSVDPATTLGVLVFRQPRLTRQGYDPQPTGPAYLIMYSPDRIGRPAVWGDGAVVDSLASGTVSAASPRPATLTLGWLSLGAGQSIPSHRVAGVELLAIESGVAMVAGPQAGTQTTTIVPPHFAPGALVPPQDRPLLMGGAAVAFSNGMSAPVDQAGSGATRALLVILAPTNASEPAARP
ncbi:MAG TPA: nuclear transport factor 2 family protein, partial [Thermomicrobiales bacterium]|nr:nuclear transport factor 2 family protein [Thermomicrobiales bacterium]